MSIKYHLMLRLFIASLLVVSAGTWFGYKDTQHETEELFDAQLARSARLILSMVQADKGHSDFSNIQRYLDENRRQPEISNYEKKETHELESGHVYETKLAFQVWDDLGNLILKSQNAPLHPITLDKNGYSDKNFLNYQWRAFSLLSHNQRYQCITAERVDVRNELIEKISANLLFVFIILVPLLSIVMWFAIKHGLAPLQNLASQIGQRDASRLEAISEKNAPSEIQTIAGALNHLLSRLRLAMDREKRMTSDAAHELRTPLAAVRLHAELAQKSNSEQNRNLALSHVIQGIDRSSHLVDQLLALTKLEPDSFSTNLHKTSLKYLLIEETALIAPLAHEKDIDISVIESENSFIYADLSSLRLLIGNLLSNAIHYTQIGGIVKASIIDTENSIDLIIEDNGPGVPKDQYVRIFERFYRVKNHDNMGCGIGLSIVMRVAEVHHASLHVSQPDQGTGLVITVSFPNE